MGDEDDGLVQGAEDVAQIDLQFGTHDGIQRAERFVEEQDVRVEHEGAHEADPLPLPP